MQDHPAFRRYVSVTAEKVSLNKQKVNSVLPRVAVRFDILFYDAYFCVSINKVDSENVYECEQN
jgi:hypothetical protein